MPAPEEVLKGLSIFYSQQATAKKLRKAREDISSKDPLTSPC